jgi:hypothetical protein
VPLVGASGKATNGCVLGSMRTYAHVSPSNEFSYSAWVEAVRAGYTFVSNGPVLRFMIDGAIPSAQSNSVAPGTPRHVSVEATSAQPFEYVKLMWNGAVIADARPFGVFPYRAVIEYEFSNEESGWLAAFCHGAVEADGEAGSQHVVALTSAISIHGAAIRDWARAEKIRAALTDLDAMLRWAAEQAHCDTPAQRARLCEVFEEARTKLAQKLS